MGSWIPGFASSKAGAEVALGAGIVAAAFLCAALGARMAPYDASRYSPRETLRPPSATHVLGTDPLGRDVFSQIIVGARISMVVGILSVVAGMAAGTALGLVAGTFRGAGPDLLMRVMDAFLVFPSLVLALAITAFLGVSLWNVIGALAITFIPSFALLVRGEVVSLREREFIAAAWAQGASAGRVMWRHFLPNVSDVLLVQASFGVGTAILTEASLSFLGLGVPPPALSWGRMLREGYSYLVLAPWISIASGAAIFLVVLAFQVLSDGLRDLVGR
ncbi:MAG TPA: ABC transporter permease [Methylomirabilota bacterium]|jgi:ABC-type dipeptide/oligopeptide/nickel transport system permease subunit|nr:ABC transporter permease [Methylomirabilota bacterium]